MPGAYGVDYEVIGRGYAAGRRTDPRIAARIWAALGDAETVLNVGAGTGSSDHHWRDPLAGLRELRRVARRVVVFQWDPAVYRGFWLIRDYLPEMIARAADRPSLAARAAVLGARMEPVPIPHDCTDGFFHAYWRRPAAYLDAAVRRCSSVWAQVGPAVEARAVAALADDLDSGAWVERNRALLELEEAELGARLLVGGR